MTRSPAAEAALQEEARRLGEELRQAREAHGWSLDDVAARLRIRAIYLQALEVGRLAGLPATAYAIGFIRNYATLLGLDAAAMARRFREAAKRPDTPATEAVPPKPAPRRGPQLGLVAGLAVAVLLGGYTTWQLFSGSRVAEQAPARQAEPARRQAEAPTPRPEAAAPSLPAPITPSGTPSGPPPGAPPATAAPTAEPSRITLRFKADAWIQLRDGRTNQQIVNRVMRGGESFAVPDREGLLLSTGSAQNVEVLVDGQPSPILDGLGGVRRDIPLVADRLRPAATRPASRNAPMPTPPVQAPPRPQ